MALLCIICAFVSEAVREDNPNGRAHLVINGQSVCLDHSSFVQGGDFSSAVISARRNYARDDK